jgi:hypothetical protein
MKIINYRYYCFLIITGLFICLARNGYAQEDPKNKERCENNRKMLADQESKLKAVNADLSKVPEPKELEDARDHMLFIRTYKNKPSLIYAMSEEEKKTLNRVMGRYHFSFEDCSKGPNASPPGVCMTELYNLIVKKIDNGKILISKKPELLQQKKEIEEKIRFHRNNLDALGCDKSEITAKESITGHWRITQGSYTGTLTVTQNQGSLSGTMSWDNHQNGRIESGNFNNGRVFFVIAYSEDLKGSYSATLDNSGKKMLDGTCSSNKGTAASWTAIKQ